jgi:hypothetical protein
VPQVDLVSESFVVADPAQVARAVHDEQFWRELWAGLRLTVLQDRGVKGIRWSCSGAMTGSCEVWLEPYGDGVIVHCYLRADLPPGPPPRWPRWRSGEVSRRAVRRRQLQVNRVVFALKDGLERGRPVAGGFPAGFSGRDDLPTAPV